MRRKLAPLITACRMIYASAVRVDRPLTRCAGGCATPVLHRKDRTCQCNLTATHGHAFNVIACGAIACTLFTTVFHNTWFGGKSVSTKCDMRNKHCITNGQQTSMTCTERMKLNNVQVNIQRSLLHADCTYSVPMVMQQ